MELPQRKPVTSYKGQSAPEFRRSIESAGINIQPQVDSTLLAPNGIYVSPETKNAFYEYSSGVVDGFKYEQYVTSYYQDLALTGEFFAAVFVIELPRPTAPVYINSRTSFTLNSVLGFQSVPVLNIESVQMEGDFSQFFTVYSKDKHALDAFTTIVPNLMVDMLSSGSQYDFEFADRYVYFYRLYGPMRTSAGGVESVSISLSSKDYLEMRDFGIKYGTKFIRAARPSGGDALADIRPLWQLVNANQAAHNRWQFVWLAGILFYFFLFATLPFIVIPFSIIWFGFRYINWAVRKRRLISRWANH